MMGKAVTSAGLAALFVGLSGCDATLPDVDLTRLACEDDALTEDGFLPCPESHYCLAQQCTPRWGCDDDPTDGQGCTRFTTRCEAQLNPLTSGVQCVSGVHTSTTTRPADPVACDCPDGLICAAYGGVAGDGTYPLYVLPEGGRLPLDQVGTSTESLALRRCVRACSRELDCSADHSCRVAAVANGLLPGDGLRNTIGVCWPNTIVDTSTTASPPQPDPLACRQNADCASQVGQVCRAQVTTLEDHPQFPAGASRTTAESVVLTRCARDQVGLAPAGGSCGAADMSGQCNSGVCANRCLILCDPQDPIPACGNRDCVSSEGLLQELEFGPNRVVDRVFICQ